MSEEIKKATSLSEAETFTVAKEEPKAKEMELVPAEDFEGKESTSVQNSDLEEMYSLAQEMVKFAHARGGVGLALPQIGIMKKGFVFLDGEDQWQMILNPEYFGDGKKSLIYERSLSYDGVYALPRYKRINAAYYTIEVDDHDHLFMKRRTRMMSGLRAFIFQNLVDLVYGKTARKLGQFIDVPKDEENGQQQG